MENNQTANTSQYKATLKSMDTEEWFDLIFYRPIGYAWACLAKKLGVTPNAITIASIFLGMGAGVLFYFPEPYWLNLIGILLLVWANSFDSADGQLARMTGQYSRLGRILDGLSGDLWFATIYVAICLREVVTSDFFQAHHWVIWVLAVVAGMCHAKQAAMADYYRQFHLFFVKGKEGSELEHAFHLKRKLARMPWKGNFWRKLTLTFYTNYTVTQEKETPAMQEFRRKLSQRHPGEIPQEMRDRFRAASRPLMKYTNILSFNVRSWALIASILCKMPWLYFVFEITVMNGLLLYMRHRHEAICRRFAAEL